MFSIKISNSLDFHVPFHSNTGWTTHFNVNAPLLSVLFTHSLSKSPLLLQLSISSTGLQAKNIVIIDVYTLGWILYIILFLKDLFIEREGGRSRGRGREVDSLLSTESDVELDLTT